MRSGTRKRLEALERVAEPRPLVFIIEYVEDWRSDAPTVVERHIVTCPPRKPGDPFDWHGTTKLLVGESDAQEL